MKKLVIILISIILVIILTVILICLYQKGKVLDGNETNENTVIEYTVEKGLTKDIYTVKAKIDSDPSENFIEHIIISKSVESSFIIYKQIGSELLKEDKIYSCDEEVFYAQFDGKLLSIDYGENDVNLTLLNYEKLTITVPVEQKIYTQINNDTNVLVSYGGNEKTTEIIKFGYVVYDLTVQLVLKCPYEILPGNDVIVSFYLGENKAGFFLSSEAIFTNNDKQFVRIKNQQGELETKEISIGSTFNIVENGTTYTYTTIKSGLCEGDKVYVETIGANQAQSSHIKDRYKNG